MSDGAPIDVCYLPPCPFCGGGETRVDEQHLNPTMRGQGALISVSIKHWCDDRMPGAIHAYREVRGRDRNSAVAEYCRRAHA